MTNSEAINKIEKYLSYDFHFTDYEFGGMNDRTGKKAPRPEKTEWLTSQFRELMLRLKDFLRTEPNKDSLSKFMISELEKLNSEKFTKEEYRMLICKYDEIPRWGLGCTAAFEFFVDRKTILKYHT